MVQDLGIQNKDDEHANIQCLGPNLKHNGLDSQYHGRQYTKCIAVHFGDWCGGLLCLV